MKVLRALLVGATVLVALFTAAAVLDPLHEGLTATYFSDTAWTSSPVSSRVERQPSTESVLDAWSGAPPKSFSVTWAGSLFVTRGGTYTLATASDDGSLVYVDGQLVVDNGGGHKTQLKTGTVQLDRGVHSIFIKFFEEGGGFEFNLSWARGDAALTAIPDWALSVRQMEFARTLASVVVRRGLIPIAIVWLVLLISAGVAELDRINGALAVLGASPARMCVLGLAIFVALAVAHTWPLASNPAHLSRNDTGDAVLNTWAIAWVAHQLPHDPRHLFDANIFYPERLTLAYSEAMIVQSVMAMPVLALGGSPVLAYNLVLIAGFALTGWAFFLLVWRWTGSWAAAFIGGSLAGFNPDSMTQLAHLQFLHVEFVALVLFALDRLLTSKRIRDAAWLGVGFALQGLTSVYLMTFTVWLVLFGVLGRARVWLRDRPARTIALLTLSGIVAIALLAPYLAGYLALHAATGVERGVDEVRRHSGSWVDYLATGSRIHYALWSRPFVDVALGANFPGVTAIVLVVLALWWPDTRGDRRLQMCGIAAVGCAAASMAGRTPIFPLLHRTILLMRAVRAPAAMGLYVVLMIAIVAGFGVAGLARRWPSTRTWPVAALVLFGLVNVEALRAPLDYTPFSRIPAVYDVLASIPNAVVVEVPLAEPRGAFRNAEYMLNSTRHWKPILNGYSGMRPDSYDAMFAEVVGFPDDRSLATFRRIGVTHVVVHGATLSGVAALTPVADEGAIHIYALK